MHQLFPTLQSQKTRNHLVHSCKRVSLPVCFFLPTGTKPCNSFCTFSVHSVVYRIDITVFLVCLYYAHGQRHSVANTFVSVPLRNCNQVQCSSLVLSFDCLAATLVWNTIPQTFSAALALMYTHLFSLSIRADSSSSRPLIKSFSAS